MSERIEIGGDEDPEAAELRSGLVTLVLSLVEIVDEALEREAVRRMESGELDPEEIERLGKHLATLDEEITALQRRENVEDAVAELRGQLDGVVDDALTGLEQEPGATTTLDADVDATGDGGGEPVDE
ncbi:gas vesicle protein K [Halorubellus salinus]|uniref:gas vesicle protein K n=1 Tax=Halorubellus salinus TaxID=755309 RepID=UPI001D085F59|nr:gas vesicle protein K [Halorubellus salinus]